MINRYASLKQGLVGAWCPSVSGSFGYRLPDLSGYGNHGTLTNMDPGTDWVPSGGKLALDFDGSNDRVALPSSVSVSTARPFSVSAWVNTINLTTQLYPKVLTLYSESSSTPFEITISNEPVYRGVVIGSAATWGNYRSDPSWVNSVWNHVAVNYDGTNIYPSCYKVFVNGVSIAITTAGLYTILGNASSIGGPASGGSSNFMYGFLDDIRIYNRALTASEIRLLYTGGRGVKLMSERIKHRRKTTAATNRRRRLICGANC